MCSPVLLVDCLDEIQINSLDDYKNPNSPIYVKFVSWKVSQAVSWKVSQAVLKSNIRANRSRQINISASQKYSNKVHKRMNRTFITRREF